MKLSYLIAASPMLVAIPLIAQNARLGTVQGLVQADSSRHSLEFTNVSLLRVSDSTIAAGTVTDSKGAFRVANLPFGGYFLRYTLLGYKEKQSAPFQLTSRQSTFDAGIVSLTETALKIGGVTITAEKPVFNEAIDRKVYNVQQAVVSSTGSVSDLLQNIPSVQVDVDGTVSLRGSANVQIMIDGKPSPLLASGGAEALLQIPASSVQTIEVITNPSAKFKPDGTSGIINLVMKKNSGSGLNGILGGNVGNRSRYNLNASASYNPGGVNFFGSYSYRKDERTSFSSELRQKRDSASGSWSRYDQNGTTYSRPFGHFVMAGFDVKLEDISRFGLSGNYRRRGYTSYDTASYLLANFEGSVTSDYDRLRIDYDQTTSYGATAFFDHKFAGDDLKIRTELNLSHMFDEEDNRFTNAFRSPSGFQEYDNTLIREYDDRIELTVDYHQKLANGSILEAGYDGQTSKNEFPFYAEYFEPSLGKFIPDVQKTNHFLFRETIHALYCTYEARFGMLSLLGGLRGENVSVTSDLVTLGTSAPSSYSRLYPTLHVAYKLSELSELQLNYSLRANRPDGGDLNPFPEYRDPTSVRAGNPLLKPEYIHSVEFGWQLQSEKLTVTPSIFYRNRFNGFTSMTRALNDSVLLTTQQNLSTDQSGGLELVLSGNFGSYLTANVSTNAFYQQIDASNLGYGNNKSAISWNGNLNCSIHVTKSTMIQINSNYRSARMTPQGQNRPSYVVNIGMRQDLLSEKLFLVLTVSDAFQTQNRRTEINTPTLNQRMFGSRDARVMYLGLTYRFGVPPKGAKEKSLQFDENG